MARRLLLILLVITQLLGGSGAALYLCIHRDGSVGLDAGRGSCGCEADPFDPFEPFDPVESGCPHDDGEHTCHSSADHETDCLEAPVDESLPSQISPADVADHIDTLPHHQLTRLSVVEPCGCLHIPLMMAKSESGNLFRLSWAYLLEHGASGWGGDFGLNFSCHDDSVVARRDDSTLYDLNHQPLKMLATVCIRC